MIFNMYEPGASNTADPMSRLPVSSDLPEVIDDANDYIGMLSVDTVPHAMLWGEIGSIRFLSRDPDQQGSNHNR